MNVYDVFNSITGLLCVIWATIDQLKYRFPCYQKVKPFYETCPKLKWHKVKGAPHFLKVCV